MSRNKSGAECAEFFQRGRRCFPLACFASTKILASAILSNAFVELLCLCLLQGGWWRCRSHTPPETREVGRPRQCLPTFFYARLTGPENRLPCNSLPVRFFTLESSWHTERPQRSERARKPSEWPLRLIALLCRFAGLTAAERFAGEMPSRLNWANNALSDLTMAAGIVPMIVFSQRINADDSTISLRSNGQIKGVKSRRSSKRCPRRSRHNDQDQPHVPISVLRF